MPAPTRRNLLLGGAATALAAATGTGLVFAESTEPDAEAAALPFDLPDNDSLKASPRKVFAHYFTAFPISLDDKEPGGDYYARNYLDPHGEQDKHLAYGGLLRDRPLPRSPLSGDWERADMATEVRRATEAGLDGFTTDLLSIARDSAHWRRVKHLLAAAPTVDPKFKIALMPDMNAGTIKNADQSTLAQAVAELVTEATFRLDDGRLLVAPFKAENRSPAWWAEFISVMADEHGEEVAFLPMVLNVNDVIHDGKNNIDAYAAISYGISETEAGAPKLQDSIPGKVAKAHAAGIKYMSTISPQDQRPNQAWYYEANNSENLRAGWNKSIEGGADWVQLMTWNDFSEGTQVTPSVHNGWVWLDLSSYHLTVFKTGEEPKIVRDTVYLSHRKQGYDDRPDPTEQTSFQRLRANSGAARDTVEALTFLTAAATVRLTAGKTPHEYTAEAGVRAETVPLSPGENAVAVTRDGATVAEVTSPFPVGSDHEVEDLQYCAVGSSR